MNRKEIARETLDIMEKGYYEAQNTRIEIEVLQEHSIRESFLLTPEQGQALRKQYDGACTKIGATVPPQRTCVRVRNCSTVDAVLKLSLELKQRRSIGVLNFASAKNPGGGFINGAMAQEESLAASSCLYKTLIAHEDYYRNNRACGSMMYTDHAIYSPDVVFFRDGAFRLLKVPVTASVLTLPAVNMGQVMLKGEDTALARQVMRGRMSLALAIFASQKCSHLILGAYGCGVFRNDPEEVAAWWHKLLEESFAGAFETVVFAVLDNSASLSCISPFQRIFPSES